MTIRRFSLPEAYEARVEALLHPLGYSLSEPKKLAAAVLRLSNHYTQNPEAATPWSEPYAQAASLAYYFPLNYARNRAVALEAARLGFFTGLESAVDFGAGMGSALHAFSDVLETLPEPRLKTDFLGYDVSSRALALAESLCPKDRALHSRVLNHGEASGTKNISDLPPPSTRLVVASYVLTELSVMPKWWQESEALAIIEPSTQADGRRLMTYRQELIDLGFKVWAPCTHQDACPLLTNSEKDWCHDRIHWQAPLWFEVMERSLPMKNRTLTYSYLLARKTLSPPEQLGRLARLTGDMLVEKGKTRQSLCRGPEREFLAWFPQRLKRGESIELQRGSLVRLEEGLEKKATEVRVASPSNLEEIPVSTEISSKD